MLWHHFRLYIGEKKEVKAVCVVACKDIQSSFCCKSCGEEMKAGNGFLVWENADELCRYVWFADSSCAWRIPLTHPKIWLLCEAKCRLPLLQSRQAQYATPLKGTVIELSGKWQYLLTWNTHIIAIGVGVGSGAGQGLLEAAVARPGSFVAGEGKGLSCWGAVQMWPPYCVLKEAGTIFVRSCRRLMRC